MIIGVCDECVPMGVRVFVSGLLLFYMNSFQQELCVSYREVSECTNSVLVMHVS